MLVLRLSFFISLFFLVFGCKNSTGPLPVDYGILIDINTVADGFGDFDGKTSESELEFISKYFANHQQAWAIGSIPAKYKNGKAKLIPAETVKNTLGYSALVGPYTSEKNLRQELAGFSIRTPFVGIYVLDRNRQCCLIRFFRAPGPQIGTADWDELVLL